MGGSEFDAATGIACSGLEDDILLTGRSNSNNGWIHGANGGRDMWAVRLQNLVTSAQENAYASMLPFPNPFEAEIFVDVKHDNTRLYIRDLSGKSLIEMPETGKGLQKIQVHGELKSGLYFLEIRSKEGTIHFPVIKH